MIAYCDTSLLVAALLPEQASGAVLSWLATRAPRSLLISDWSITELPSALSVKFRSGQLSVEERVEALEAWTALRKSSLVTVRVKRSHFAIAATCAGRAELGLRAGDALHLAVAADNGCAIATLDERQGKAAIELGIPREIV